MAGAAKSAKTSLKPAKRESSTTGAADTLTPVGSRHFTTAGTHKHRNEDSNISEKTPSRN
jgi:hypothetical protein